MLIPIFIPHNCGSGSFIWGIVGKNLKWHEKMISYLLPVVFVEFGLVVLIFLTEIIITTCNDIFGIWATQVNFFHTHFITHYATLAFMALCFVNFFILISLALIGDGIIPAMERRKLKKKSA